LCRVEFAYVGGEKACKESRHVAEVCSYCSCLDRAAVKCIPRGLVDRVERHLCVAALLGHIFQQGVSCQAYGMTKQEVVQPAASNCPKLSGRLRSPCHALEHSRCSSSETKPGLGRKKVQEVSFGLL
jgi:hypothetical protein